MSEQPQAQTGPVVIDEEALAAKRQPKKSAVAALVGSALEYYDFFIFGTAASLIFPRLMYDPTNSFQANVMSTASFGVAYLVRPIGSFIMGSWATSTGASSCSS